MLSETLNGFIKLKVKLNESLKYLQKVPIHTLSEFYD
jgi:hypothetical protein